MKRYLCTVAAGMLLALAGTATASATDLPDPGQTATQTVGFGDQTVGEQRNDADVTQEQGNGNVSIAPAIAVFGDAETTNYQGNGNEANADVDQKNSVDQTQDSYQRQSLDSSGSGSHCCDGQSQTGEQRTYGGDQTVEKQKNDADVTQKQGNGNVWIGPAVAIGGDAESRNYQGNGNAAYADVEQRNDADQSQSSTQKQYVKEGYGGYGHGREGCCEHGSSQTGEQKTSFGDQSVDKQENDADVTQEQGNDNVAIAPAVAVGGKKGGSCSSKCGGSGYSHDDDATTTNKQGNHNTANADVDQRNSVDQTQSSTQKQTLTRKGRGCCKKPTYHGKKGWGGKECCERGSSQTGEQKTSFGDQSVGEQRNDADVTQEQGNRNGSFAPAWAFGGDAETTNKQGNGNEANADVDQKNTVDQTQDSYQRQELVEACKRMVS